MTEIPIFGGQLVLEITDRGVSDVPAYFSQRILDQIVIKSHEHAFPEHVQVMIRQRKKIIREIIHQGLVRALNSDRYNLAQQLRARGMNEAADYLMTERVTK